MGGRTVVATPVVVVLLALLSAGLSGCGEAKGSVLDSPSASSPAVPSPTPVPTGLLTAVECPGERVGGIKDYFGDTPGQPWQRAVAQFDRELVHGEHPDAVPRVARQTEQEMEVAFVDSDGRRVAWLVLERASTGWWWTSDQACVRPRPEKDAGNRHY